MILRQGDIVLIKISNEIDSLKIPNSHEHEELVGENVVAYGETTGHHHKFSGGLVRLYRGKEVNNNNDPVMVSVESEHAILSHQEHLDIRIPRGTYKVIREITYDPFRKFTQNAVTSNINTQINSSIQKYNHIQSEFEMRSRKVTD